MTILAPATSPDDWDDRDVFAAIDWDSLEPTAAELAEIGEDVAEYVAQERAFASLVSRLAPAAVKHTGRRSRRRPGRRRPRPIGCAGRRVRTEATR